MQFLWMWYNDAWFCMRINKTTKRSTEDKTLKYLELCEEEIRKNKLQTQWAPAGNEVNFCWEENIPSMRSLDLQVSSTQIYWGNGEILNQRWNIAMGSIQSSITTTTENTTKLRVILVDSCSHAGMSYIYAWTSFLQHKSQQKCPKYCVTILPTSPATHKIKSIFKWFFYQIM